MDQNINGCYVRHHVTYPLLEDQDQQIILLEV